jgi:hypothetical protein
MTGFLAELGLTLALIGLPALFAVAAAKGRWSE